MKAADRPCAATSGRQARPPCAKRFAHHGTGEPRGAFRGIGVQRGEKERPPQPLVERPVAGA